MRAYNGGLMEDTSFFKYVLLQPVHLCFYLPPRHPVLFLVLKIVPFPTARLHNSFHFPLSHMSSSINQFWGV